jgi:hypothetical protein
VKVIVSEDLFSAHAVGNHPFLLSSLFHACEMHDHELELAFDVQKSSSYLTWRGSRSIVEGEQVDMVVRSSQQSAARERLDRVVIATLDPTDWTASPPRVGPEALIPLLHQPLTILVENEVNDGAFLKAVGFGFDRDAFLTCLDKGRIRFDHAGGSSMSDLIRTRGQDRARAFRMWAMFDSDALVPGEPSAEARIKSKAARSVGIQPHMLQRRAIENYLPHHELDEATPYNHKDITRRKTVGAFGRLQATQRAHYNLKGGFRADHARLQPGSTDAGHRPAVDALYADVTAKDRAALAHGFGKDIAELFVVAPDKGRPGITEARRRHDGQEAEMGPLFRAIIRSL